MSRFARWLALSIGTIALAVATAEPASQNLIVNGGFEDGTDSPTGWRFGTGTLENFQYGRTHDCAHGRLAARIITKSDAMSGYWAQTVKVKPHTRYRLKLMMKLEAGKVLVYVRGKGIEKRLYLDAATENPLVPVFIPPKWALGVCETNVWLSQSLDFDSGMADSVTVNLGSYFRTGAVNFDDIELVEIK